MPTGYTAAIKDGISFEKFAMDCARAFGACVTLRDEPGGGEQIPFVFEADTWHANAAQKARDELAALLAMPDEQRERAAAKAWDDAETARLMRIEEGRKLRQAYEAMLAKAQAWKPPTPEHEELRKFMCEQITESIRFDCRDDIEVNATPRQNGDQWAAEKAARLKRDIAYHDKQQAAEVQRAATRTAWVRQLRASL
jgi:hypothetical protein